MSEPLHTNLHDVPVEGGLRADEGWVDMQVQFLINQASGSDATIATSIPTPMSSSSCCRATG
jgi:hypothetical protein